MQRKDTRSLIKTDAMDERGRNRYVDSTTPQLGVVMDGAGGGGGGMGKLLVLGVSSGTVGKST